MKLANIKEITIQPEEVGEPAAVAHLKGGRLYIPFQGLIDLGKEKDRQVKKLQKTNKDIEQLNARLNDRRFMENAEAELIEEKKEALSQALRQKDLLETGIRLLSGK